jgi:NADH-quinone oxidoreductase subunit J
VDASSIIFYVISAFILGAAIISVTSAKIFRAAIALLFSLIGIAGLYFWMQVEFIAAVQIVVYVGGIVVLIIFSIFLTQQSGSKMPQPSMKRNVFSILAALLGLGFTYNLIREYGFASAPVKPFVVSVSDIGMAMLSTTEHGYVLPFEVVSMLLLSAMIGCIVIAMKVPPAEGNVPADDLVNQEPAAPALKPLSSILMTPSKEKEEVVE